MAGIHNLKPERVITAFKRAGWESLGRYGKHFKLRKGGNPNILSIPVHGGKPSSQRFFEIVRSFSSVNADLPEPLNILSQVGSTPDGEVWIYAYGQKDDLAALASLLGRKGASVDEKWMELLEEICRYVRQIPPQEAAERCEEIFLIAEVFSRACEIDRQKALTALKAGDFTPICEFFATYGAYGAAGTNLLEIVGGELLKQHGAGAAAAGAALQKIIRELSRQRTRRPRRGPEHAKRRIQDISCLNAARRLFTKYKQWKLHYEGDILQACKQTIGDFADIDQRNSAQQLRIQENLIGRILKSEATQLSSAARERLHQTRLALLRKLDKDKSMKN